MKHPAHNRVRFPIPAIAVMAVMTCAACSPGRGAQQEDAPREAAPPDAGPAASETPLPPGELSPAKPESEEAAAIDGLLSRGGRLLQERQFDLAVELFEGAMRDSRAAGESTRLTRSALGLAEALASQGREPEAAALAAGTRKQRPAGPPTVDALRLAALESALILALGRPLEAAPVARQALDEADRHHPGDAFLRGLLVSSLTDALVATEGFAEAARLLDDHLSRPEVRSSLAPEEAAGWKEQAGRLHGAAGNFSVSVARLEESLIERAAAGGDDPLPAAVIRISLAASLFDAGHPAQARTEALAAHAALSAALPADHPERLRLAEVAARIGVDLAE